MLSLVQQKITSELGNNETLIWCGQPKGGFRWRKDDFFSIPLFLFMFCGMIFWTFMAFSSKYVPIYMKLFGLIAVTVVTLLNLRKFIDKWNREHTYYGVTDKNIIIVTDFFGRCVNKFALNDLGEVHIISFDDSRSTIVFGIKRSWLFRVPTFSWHHFLSVKSPFLDGESNAHLQLDSIEDGAKVYSMIQDACRKRLDIESNTSFPDMPATGKNKGFIYYLSNTVGLLIGVVAAWHFFSGAGPRIIDSFRGVHKHSAPKDVCAEWQEGKKAEEKVAQARSRHPEYAELTAREAHRKGLELDRHGQYANAIYAWECEVAKNPNSIEGLNDIAYAYQRLNNPELALEYANKATAINPGFGHGHYTAGRALLIMGRYAEAESELKMAINNGWMQGGDSQELLGLALRGQGDDTGAISAFQQSLDLQPNDEETKRYISGEKFNPTWVLCRERMSNNK